VVLGRKNRVGFVTLLQREWERMTGTREEESEEVIPKNIQKRCPSGRLYVVKGKKTFMKFE